MGTSRSTMRTLRAYEATFTGVFLSAVGSAMVALFWLISTWPQ